MRPMGWVRLVGWSVTSATTIWPWLGLAQAVAGDDDLVGQALVVRHHEADAALLVEAPDHAVGLALQDLHHAALQAPAAVASR